MSKCITIVSGYRAAAGRFGGALKDLEAADLRGTVIKETVGQPDLKPEDIEEIVYGCVGQATENAFATRLVSVKAGTPYEATTLTVNRLCSSGLQVIVTAIQEIEGGMCGIVAAGGCEGMTNISFHLRKTRYRYHTGHGELEDGLITALSDLFTRSYMGIATENVANQYNVTRQEQDRWAAISQRCVGKAQGEGKFDSEVVPIGVKVSKKETMIFGRDEHAHPGATAESLAKLHPAFEDDGNVTAGNAAGINDAAAAMVLIKEPKANTLGLKPLVRLVDVAAAGVDPPIIRIGPVPAFRKLLKKTRIRKEKIEPIELNEALVAQAAACMKELELDENAASVSGSGISLGHPIGTTGCIITIKLINEVTCREVRYGVPTLCVGGGQGPAVLFELCS